MSPALAGARVALAASVAFAGAAIAACSNAYRALPGDGGAPLPPEEPLDCITFSVFDLVEDPFCRTDGVEEPECTTLADHSQVTVDRAARTITGLAANDPTKKSPTIPADKGEAYAVFDLPGSPRKVLLDHTFRVDAKSASKMAYTPGCSLEWLSGKVQNNLDLNVGRDGLAGVYYYRGSIPDDGTFLNGQPFPTRTAILSAHLEAYATETGSRIATKISEGQTVYLDVTRDGQPTSSQGELRDFVPDLFRVYCGMSVQDGDGTQMRATGTSFDPKITACYPKGAVPPKPTYTPPPDAGVSDGGPKDAGRD